MKRFTALLLVPLLSASAYADLNIGISLSTTGPGASLGIPERNTIAMLPGEIAGEKVNYLVLDDATDSTSAAKNARKLVGESQVDLLIGSTTVPTSSAMAQIARESGTPLIVLAPLDPQGEEKKWVFTIPQTNGLMAGALIGHMRAQKVQTLGFIGYSDAWGDDWYRVLSEQGAAAGIKLTSNERFNRTDASVSGQALKVLSSRPDAVLIGATGTPAALPHTELRRLGYKGLIYHTHGAANQAFLRIGGKALDGAIMPVGPVMVWDKLPDAHPSKGLAGEYVKAYEALHGPDSLSPFGAYVFDAAQLLEAAAPQALAKARPGSAEFRSALREAMESAQGVVGTHGVYNLSADDHFGHDERGRTLVTVQDQKWVLLEAGQ